MNMKRVTIAFVVVTVALLASAVLPTKFRWDNKDGKCYVTPVKTVTDVRQIWAAVTADMLESLYLIQSDIDYNKLSPEDREKMAVSVESILAECNHVPGMAPDTNSNQGEGKDVTKTYEYLLRKGYQSKARVTDILLWQGITNAQEENSEEWLDRLSSAKAGLQRKPIFSYCYMSDNYTDSKYYFMCPHSYVTPDRCRENYRPVLVIGYDDTIPAARFKHKNFDEIPAGDGAWIVKGVHGDGIDGTFYVSYYDKNLFKYEYESFFIYPEFIAEQTQMLTLDLTNEFGQFYCHNEGSPAGIDMQDLYPRSTCANMFLASSDDMLSALGAFRMSFSTVEVSVYTNCVAGNPVSGTLATKVKVRCDHWGYNIRRMTEQVPIKKGQWFSLVTDDTDMLVWTKSTNPQQGRSFVCPPRSEWRDTVSPNTDGVLEGNYTPKWWTRGGLNRSTCDTPFLTAYTANEQKDIELKASDGEVEEGIYITWTQHENGIYDLYRAGSNGVESLIASGLTQAMYFDKSKEYNGEVKLDEKYYYRR